MESYHYEPLPKDTLRLLTIVDRNSPVIQCTLSTFSLEHPPTYSALSYTWGSAVPGDGLTPELDHTLLCDGGKVPITANLERALRSVPFPHGHIWADAVCVNQRDVTERSEQVAIMGKIYAQASQVTVWLGSEDEHTGPAFDFIRDFSSRVSDEMRRADWLESLRFFVPDGMWQRIGRPEWSVPERRALVWLFMRNWFSRAWVIQEVVLARDVMVSCGSYSVPWSALVPVSNFVTSHGLIRIAVNEVEGTRDFLTIRDGVFRPIGSLPYHIARLKERCESLPALLSDRDRDHLSAMLLRTIIHTTWNMQATEPKDKIFAPVGLLLQVFPSEELVVKLRPDYSKCVARVFTEVCSYQMQHVTKPQGVYILSRTANITHFQVEGLPSWVPDYRAHIPSGISARPPLKFNCLAGLALDKFFELNPRGPKLGLWASQFNTVSVLLPPLFQKDWTSVTELLPLLQFAAELPDLDARGEPAIQSMIHSLTALEPPGYEYAPEHSELRDVLTRILGLLVSRSQMSVDKILAPGSILHGLLDGFERRGITSFPTCADIRDTVGGTAFAEDSESEALGLMRYSNQRLFHSAEGFLGIMPAIAQTGDGIFFVPGSKAPFVFRKTSQSDEYELVGEAYVHGAVYGELWREGLQPEWSSVTLV